MEWYWALVLLIGLSVGLMFLGVPVAFAFFGANIIGAMVFLGGEAGLMQFARNIWESVGSFSLVSISLFLLMGEIMYFSGLAGQAIDAIDRLISRVPGRLSLVAICSGTTFAALTGSSLANTAVLGSTLIPEMKRRGYHPTMSMGPILGTGGIAMLIPPSGLAIILGSLSGISIAGILIGGAIPGLALGLLFFVYVMLRCKLNPALAPAYEMESIPFWDRVKPFLIYVVPLLSLFVIVVGSILMGIATPSESAALGAVASVIIALAYRKLTWANFMLAVAESGRVSVIILTILAASLTFSQLLGFSGATQGLLEEIRALDPSPVMLLALMLGIVLFLGCFMDPLSIMLICIPFFMPLANIAQFDLIWFGVLLLLALEIGQITPPFGLLLFVMKGVAPPGTTTRMVYQAAAPFILLQAAVLLILAVEPATVTWLQPLLSANR